MNGQIYALRNPINNDIFYIGATSKSLDNRLRQHYSHLNEALLGVRVLNKRLKYLKELLPVKATIECLEKCETNLFEKEIYYIEIFTKNNHPLLNGTKGGQGGNTYQNLTEEEIKVIGEKISLKLKGKDKPDGFAENLSIKRMGSNNPAAGKTKYDKIVVFKDNKAIRIFQGGYEINEFCNYPSMYGNLIKKLVKNKGVCFYREYLWKFLKECNEEEIKDIV